MTLSMMRALKSNDAKSDLLLKFFTSEAFDEWFAIVYLHSSPSAGVQDYLSNKLFELPERGIEKYLLQLVYISVSRPGSAVERTLVELCSRSFRLALKISWLVHALCQDQPKNKHLENLKQECEKSALDGRWAVPFENHRLDPLSPSEHFPLGPGAAPLLSLSAHEQYAAGDAAAPPSARLYDDGAAHFLGQGLDGILPLQPLSPVGRQLPLKLDLTCLETAEQRGLTMSCISGPDSDRFDHLRQQLGEGEGVTALLVRSKETAGVVVSAEEAEHAAQPLSPTSKLRHDRFGATLDFVDALCAASSHLAILSQEQRLKALRTSLETINHAIQEANQRDTAVCYPLGSQNLRILRIAHTEAVLLNSRDKAPFMLFVEVLEEPEDEAEQRWHQSLNHVPGKAKHEAADCADSACSLLGSGRHSRAPSSTSVHDSAMTELQCDSCTEWPDAQTVNSYTGSMLGPPHLASTPDSSLADSATPSPLVLPNFILASSPAATPSLPHQLKVNTVSPAAVTQSNGSHASDVLAAAAAAAAQAVCPAPQQPHSRPSTAPISQSRSLPPMAPSSISSASANMLLEYAQKPLAKIKNIWEGSREEELHSQQQLLQLLEGGKDVPEKSADSLVRRMDAARAGLAGDAPLVKLIITVLDEDNQSSFQSTSSYHDTDCCAEQDQLRRQSSVDAGPGPPSSGIFGSFTRKSSDGGDTGSNKAMSILQSFRSGMGLCRRPEAGCCSPTKRTEQKLISLRLEVAGGINLQVQPQHRRSRRMPSHEAIDMMADKFHVASIPPPAESGPPLSPSAEFQSSDGSDQGDAGPFGGHDSPLFTERQVKQRINQGACLTTAQGGMHCHENARQCLQKSISEAIAQPIDASMDKARREPLTPAQRQQREASAVYGERWASKVKRLRRQSPEGKRPGWSLRCAIVKTGDDCRQEQMAIQLITVFKEIWHEAGLPLWVKPYEVLCTSNRTAMIELIANSLSIHTIKHRSPPGTSLSDHFFAKYGRGTPECAVAQRNFVESLAAYSIICYILQIKDRHNGNIMLDDEGHIVHIDFGFMLSNSPGGVNFETSPFKLTRECLEIMDSNAEGRMSELFDLFKVLFLQGFLAVRKKCDRIVLLVKMMSKSSFPCFKAGDTKTVKALEKRFHLGLSDVQCVQVVLQLIGESMDSWRTRQYDYYQRVLNGIL